VSTRRLSEPQPSDCDVAVVGAGPAGAVCALDLARAGLSVALLDRAAPPRYKTCGGGIVGRAIESLDLDISACFERSLNRVEVRLADSDAVFAVERSPAPIVMTMRATFDALLIDAARAAGATLLAPWSLRSLRRVGDRYEVRTDRGDVNAAWVIGADGAGGRVARAAGWRSPMQGIPAIESEIRVSDQVFARFAGAARFDFGVPADGYGWVFPKAEHLSVGCLTTGRRSRGNGSESGDLKRHFEAYLGRLGLDRPIAREDHGFVIPTRPRAPSAARDRVLLVGDAAGLADPLTCEGISNAIRSGRIAARAVIETRAAPDRTAERYQELLGAEILGELRWARRLAPLLYGAPGLRALVFRRVGPSLCEAFTDIFSGRRTYSEVMRRPASYRRFLVKLIHPALGARE
jgi:geranylgeranyl reductase family protein